VFLILFGAAVAAIGLQAFLIPNHLLDGGVVGLSIISATLSHLPLGLFLIALNIPFIYLGWRKLGRGFTIAASLGIITLALATTLFHLKDGITHEPLLAAVFGGVLVGIGVGTVIRAGGTLDGTEVLAILADRRLPFSIGEIILFLNIFILGSAGFVFGWDNAMYSLIAYFVAYKTIDVTVAGLDESRSAFIVCNRNQEVALAIRRELGHDVTILSSSVGNMPVAGGALFVVITRIEERRLKALVFAHDKHAFVAFAHVHEVVGKSTLD
jgi:uncharacterized membrane-anchored protein YitT (DUF2179 family)